MSANYPVVIDLKGKRCLVVGGGRVAERKVRRLLEVNAEVTVVSPQVTENIEEWRRSGRLTWVKRGYRAEDVRGVFFTLAATDSRDVNRRVGQDVQASGGLVNVADPPEAGNVIIPSALRRGKLLFSVSTSGASPGLARMICRRLEEEYGPEYEDYVDFLFEARQYVREKISSQAIRRQLFQELLQETFFATVGEKGQKGAFELLKARVEDVSAGKEEAFPPPNNGEEKGSER